VIPPETDSRVEVVDEPPPRSTSVSTSSQERAGQPATVMQHLDLPGLHGSSSTRRAYRRGMDQAEHSVGPFMKAEGGLSRVTCICGESLTGEVVDVVARGHRA
jgi:hypothetical protein